MQLRESILKDVNRTIEQRKTHGDATQTFHNLGKKREAYQAALFCVISKKRPNPNVDNWRDMIGYLAVHISYTP